MEKILYFSGDSVGPTAEVHIKDWRFVDDIFAKGDIGLGESFINQYWTSPDISKVIEIAVKNQSALKKIIHGSVFKILFYRFKHLLNKNTKSGSKEKYLQFIMISETNSMKNG